MYHSKSLKHEEETVNHRIGHYRFGINRILSHFYVADQRLLRHSKDQHLHFLPLLGNIHLQTHQVVFASNMVGPKGWTEADPKLLRINLQ